MKLEVGMYVRTLDGISKVIEVREDDVMSRFVNKDGNVYFDGDMMCNPSYDLVDLIEVGDYANGLLVTRICEDIETNKKYINLYGSISEWEEEDIKSIVTKEQFESMSYKVEV